VNYFISGGTGTIGKELVAQLLAKKYCLRATPKIIVYSRDEAKQAEMSETFPPGGVSGMRYIVGDICDYDRLVYGMKGSDIVIHAAAMKRIDTCEYNPIESLRVNVLGSLSVAKACIECGVRQAVFLSTDKACNPCSAYGAQKAAVERLWIGMNNMTYKTCFNVVRYGNVYGSRGSVIDKWKDQAAAGEPLTVTSDVMTRFFWNVDEAASFILKRVADADRFFDRGLIYIPKTKSFKIVDIALSIGKEINVVGLRCPEKLHEDLISEVEGMNAWDQGDFYIVCPSLHHWSANIIPRGSVCPDGFSLSSRK